MKLRSGPAAVAVGVVFAALIALLWLAPTDPDREGANPLIGKPAPGIVATALDGESLRLEDLRGEWVVVNFFATWCTPCKVEHPELVAWTRTRAAGGGGRVISVAYDDSPRAIEQFFADNGGDWPVVVDGADRIILDYGVVKLPESFLVDPRGVVVHKFVGGLTVRGIDGAIAAADRRGSS